MATKQRMIPDDEKKGHAKTSLFMTRSMSEDVAILVKKILEDIDNDRVNLSYTQWQEFISYIWHDEIWIDAFNKAIREAKRIGLKLNDNVEFLDEISTRTPSELKKEFKSTHPISSLSLKLIPTKKPPEPDIKRKYEDLWLNPDELREKYKKYEEGET